MKKLLIPAVGFLAFTPKALAHCPLCTIGAAAAAGGAAWLGVSEAAIGVFIGAFAASIGYWIFRVLKKEYIPFQREALILLSFLTTVVPMMPIIGGQHGVFIPWIGEYGKTYMVNLFLIGSVIGGLVVMAAPWISNRVTTLRKGKQVPYQGISITFALLVVLAVAFQIMV